MAESNAERTFGDLVYEAFYSGGLGGSVVALYFLLVDVVRGELLYTPSLIGSVLFLGVPAESVTAVRLDMVAYYTLVHFMVFGAVGVALTLLVHEVELHASNPLAVLALLFLVFEGGFIVASKLVIPGVVSALGGANVAIANLLAAGSMAIFLLSWHRPDLWQEVKQTLHVA